MERSGDLARANSRYVAVKFSVRGRDLGSTVEEAIKKVNAKVKLPQGYTLDWAGEYENQKRSQRRLLLVLPLTILLIYVILYMMFKSLKWALLIVTNIANGADRRTIGAADHRYKLQCVIRSRLSLRSSESRCKSGSSWLNTSTSFGPEGTRLKKPLWKARFSVSDRL